MSTTISASLVKELRDATGAGMMDCKRALEETGGDLEAARTLLRERGMAQAAKRAGRATTEGMVGYRIEGNVGTMVAVGCETEPVSKNDEFARLGEERAGGRPRRGPAAAEALEEERVELSAKLGENIVVVGRRALRGGRRRGHERVHAPAGEQDRRAREARRRRRGARPPAGDAHLVRRSASGRPARTCRPRCVAAEKQVYLNSDELEGKPEQAKEKIVEGMLAKRFFAAQPGGALTEQPWIHDSSKTVGAGAVGGRRACGGFGGSPVCRRIGP